MQSHYVGDIQLYILMWAVNCLNWNEMCRLRQTVHNYPDGIVTLLRGWKTVDVSPPIACRGGIQGSMFGLRRILNSTVNARDSRFILVRALDCDRVIALRPVGVIICVGLIV